MNKKSVKEEIVGTWKLQSIFYKDAEGKKIDLYGKNPNGILMYDKLGYMNAQIGQKSREKMSSAALTGGSDSEKVKAFDSFMAYYGKYYEKEPGEIIHEVEACLIPNWEKEDEIRYCEINGETLYITTPTTVINNHETVIEVFWKRLI